MPAKINSYGTGVMKPELPFFVGFRFIYLGDGLFRVLPIQALVSHEGKWGIGFPAMNTLNLLGELSLPGLFPGFGAEFYLQPSERSFFGFSKSSSIAKPFIKGLCSGLWRASYFRTC